MKKSFRELVEFYSQRFAFQQVKISEGIHPETRLILVIPCFKEKSLIPVFTSLKNCIPPKYPVEVIAIINAGEQASDEVKMWNIRVYEEAKEWVSQHMIPFLNFHFLLDNKLPKKAAGVGLARKIGMDEALFRLGSIDRDGGIVCLDTDCVVAENYLCVLEDAFEKDIYSASIYFEHRAGENKVLDDGIVQYELFLRYYVQGLKYAGYPYAFHTIGSSMACRASVYALTGGMNRRKAGEDFYFLHKIAPQGNHINLNATTVYPSARVSDRVPFGTGKAQQRWLDNDEKILRTYHPAIFDDLKNLFASADLFFKCNKEGFEEVFLQLPTTIRAFFLEDSFFNKIQEINQKSRTLNVFRKHFFTWMDGLKVLKTVHFLRDNYYPEIPLNESIMLFVEKIKPSVPATAKDSLSTLLSRFRVLDKQG